MIYLELRVERRDGSKIVPYSPTFLCAHRTYITPTETEPEIILKEVAVRQLRVKLWLHACSTENVQQKQLKLLHFFSSKNEGEPNAVGYLKYV